MEFENDRATMLKANKQYFSFFVSWKIRNCDEWTSARHETCAVDSKTFT